MVRHNYLLIFFLLCCCCQKEKSSVKSGLASEKIDTVKYAYDGFNMGHKLDLLTNGNFISNNYLFSCFGGGQRTEVWGRFEIKNAELKLFPEKVKFTEYSDDLVPKPITMVYNYHSDSLEFKTNYSIIQWNGLEYLLSSEFDQEDLPELGLKKENDFIRLADYYNSGIEPEEHGIYLVQKGQRSDSINWNLDLNQIPMKWRSIFLEEPISAKILNIEKVNHPLDPSRSTWFVEINKGSKDNINKSLRFQGKDGNYLMNITRITNSRSYGYFYYEELDHDDLPIGMELRTKWKK